MCVCSNALGPDYAIDGNVRSETSGQYAGSWDPNVLRDPYVTLSITLDRAYPNILAVNVWQYNSQAAIGSGQTTNINVWLHEFSQTRRDNLPAGNKYAFLSGVLCAQGLWPTQGAATSYAPFFARCNQTIGGTGARFVTFLKNNNWTASTVGVFNVMEVQILYEGERVALGVVHLDVLMPL